MVMIVILEMANVIFGSIIHVLVLLSFIMSFIFCHYVNYVCDANVNVSFRACEQEKKENS